MGKSQIRTTWNSQTTHRIIFASIIGNGIEVDVVEKTRKLARKLCRSNRLVSPNWVLYAHSYNANRTVSLTGSRKFEYRLRTNTRWYKLQYLLKSVKIGRPNWLGLYYKPHISVEELKDSPNVVRIQKFWIRVRKKLKSSLKWCSERDCFKVETSWRIFWYLQLPRDWDKLKE